MNAAWLSDTVWPRSEPATRAAYTGCGNRFCARRCATATDSNQGFCFQGFSIFMLPSYEVVSRLAALAPQPPAGTNPASGLSAQSLTGGRVISLSITGWLRVGLALEWSW